MVKPKGRVVKEDLQLRLKSERLGMWRGYSRQEPAVQKPSEGDGGEGRAKNLAWKREPGRILRIHSHPWGMGTN